MITPEKKIFIQRILNCIETGNPDGDYDNITILPDGPLTGNGGNERMRQVTYGKTQTTEWGNLKDLVAFYIQNNGKFAEDMKRYTPFIGKRSLVNDKNFISLLEKAGKDPIMVTTQDSFFDSHYWNKAFAWFNLCKFTLPLSMLVIYDSFIQSGGILDFLRNRFSEVPPSKGGDEKAWITAYVKTRHSWLSNNIREDLRNSSYRTNDLLRGIKEENWELVGKFHANDVDIV